MINNSHEGRTVQDEFGDFGIILKYEDNHNIYVKLNKDSKGKLIDGLGIYCQVKDCSNYSPLKLIRKTKRVNIKGLKIK